MLLCGEKRAPDPCQHASEPFVTQPPQLGVDQVLAEISWFSENPYTSRNIELIFIGKFQEISLFYSCEKKVLCLFPRAGMERARGRFEAAARAQAR